MQALWTVLGNYDVTKRKLIWVGTHSTVRKRTKWKENNIVETTSHFWMKRQSHLFYSMDYGKKTGDRFPSCYGRPNPEDLINRKQNTKNCKTDKNEKYCL